MDIIILHSCAYGRAGSRVKESKDLNNDQAKKLIRSGYARWAVPSDNAPAKKAPAKKAPAGKQNRIVEPEEKAVLPGNKALKPSDKNGKK